MSVMRAAPGSQFAARPFHLRAFAAGADGAVSDQMQRLEAEQVVPVGDAGGDELDAVSLWQLSDRADPITKRLADRHYNRQHPDSPQFVPPGRCVVLRTPAADAFWITSWPYEEYVQHEWAGAWVNTAFRREGGALASDLIRSAVAATRAYWSPPPLGLVTFVDPAKVKHKRDPGRCYVKAGFKRVGTTKGGLLAFQMEREAMPVPNLPLNAQLRLELVVEPSPSDLTNTPRP